MVRWITMILAVGLAVIDMMAGRVELYTLLLLAGGVLILFAPTTGAALLAGAVLTALLVDWGLALFLLPVALLGVWAARLHRRRQRARAAEAERADRADRFYRQQLGE